jgi:hypothetical protein
MSLQRIVRQLEVKQTKGIFSVPDVVKEDPYVGRFREKLLANLDYTPLVVQEETYKRSTISRKLLTDKTRSHWPVNRLAHYGVVRPQKGRDFRYGEFVGEPINTLSLAQLISWIFNEPIENIWLPKSTFEEEDFKKKDVTEQIIILFNAYRGSYYLNHLENNMASHVKKTKMKKEDFPIVREWQGISLRGLLKYFPVCTKSTINPLFERGLFIPLREEFKHGSTLNGMINNIALAQLIALIYDTEIDNILIRTKDDEYLKKLTSTYLTKRLLPFLENNNIDPIADYTVGDAARKIGKGYTVLYRSICTGVVPHTEIDPDGTRVKGVDLAIYKLKRSEKKSYNERDVCNLFGKRNLDFSHLGMVVTSEGKISRIWSLFPIYRLISDSARKTLLEEIKNDMHEDLHYGAVLVPFQRENLIITESAQNAYCREYDIKKFTDECARHIRDQLLGTLKNGPSSITTNELMLTTTFGKYIVDVRRI